MSNRIPNAVPCSMAALVCAATALLAYPDAALSCSLEQRPQPLRVVPGATDTDVPTNVIFSPPPARGGLDSDSYFWSIDDEPVDLEVDAELTRLMSFEEPFGDLSTAVYRPMAPLRRGDQIAACYRDSCGDERSIVTDTIDETPPTKPVIEDIRITLYDDPSRGPGTFCPELDFIQVELRSSDDTTPLELNRVLIYAGPTRDAVDELDGPNAAVGGELTDDEARLRVESWLGLDSDRNNDYSPLSRSADVCFSLALMDWAGNVSERSDIECVNTRDPNGPYAKIVEGAGCGCSSTGHPARHGASLLFALAGVLVLRTRAQRG